MAPTVRRVYRQPQFCALLQQDRREARGTLLHEGRALGSVKFGVQMREGMKAYAMAVQMTVPRGWKTERKGRRRRWR